MLERVQERSWLHALGLQDRTHLRGAQKALAQWAIVDDYNNILDLSCQDTRLLRFLSQKYSLRACGIADDPEHARALRLELPERGDLLRPQGGYSLARSGVRRCVLSDEKERARL